MYCSRLDRTVSMLTSSTLRITQGWAVDADGMAVMTDSAQHRIDHSRVAQEVAPFSIVQVSRNHCGVAVIALFHQLEEDVRLFRLKRKVA